MLEKSIIRDKNVIKQVHSFDGMVRHRGIYPTDIDGIIDYNGEACIILEGKYGQAKIPIGQQKLLEVLCNTYKEAGKDAVCFVYNHNIPTHDVVIVANQKVSKMFYDGIWYPVVGATVIQMIERYESFVRKKNIEI